MSGTGKDRRDIKKISDNYLAALEKKPAASVNIEEIESNFAWMDKLHIVMTYGSSRDHNELSWKSFLSSRGIDGPGRSAVGCILAGDDPFGALKELRGEYYAWIDMMVAHRDNPDGSCLIETLKKADDRGACELLPWFCRYPSKEATSVYAQRVCGAYPEHPVLTLGLARMGDEEVVRWAAARVETDPSRGERMLALGCIACSPLEEADRILGKVIEAGRPADICRIVRAFEESRNRRKFEWIEQMLQLAGDRAELRDGVEFLLAGPLMSENRNRAMELLKRMAPSRQESLRIPGKAGASAEAMPW
ncbi:MAG: hypothetical protein ABFD98_03945 [Syntrophobacteraceae bacterium]|nr:hypothetical protein [Desulfobacteraceae bacterium]